MDRTRPCLYLLQSLYSEKLLASDGSKFPEDPQDRVLCETCGIRRWSRRSLAEQFKVGPINPAVAHNKREEPVRNRWSSVHRSKTRQQCRPVHPRSFHPPLKWSAQRVALDPRSSASGVSIMRLRRRVEALVSQGSLVHRRACLTV